MPICIEVASLSASVTRRTLASAPQSAVLSVVQSSADVGAQMHSSARRSTFGEDRKVAARFSGLDDTKRCISDRAPECPWRRRR